jgi:hypothetical protein
MSEMCGCGRSVLDAYDRQPSDAQPWRDGRMQGEGASTYIPDDGEPAVPVAERMAVRRPTSAELIENEYNLLCDLSLAKNEAYGDSALHPVRIFSKADALAGIDARIDDKLSRVKHAPEAFGEDVEADLIGYLVLRRIARRLGGV